MQNIIKALIFTTAVAALYVFGEAIQYDRGAIFNGEVWRTITGHFVHWTPQHLLWDLLAFFILSALLFREEYSTSDFCFLLFFCPLFSSISMLHFIPEMNLYRGISAIDTALVTTLALTYLKKERLKLFGRIILSILAVKIAWEFQTEQSLFSSNEAYRPVPLAHLSGFLSAIITSFSKDFIRSTALPMARGSY